MYLKAHFCYLYFANPKKSTIFATRKTKNWNGIILSHTRLPRWAHQCPRSPRSYGRDRLERPPDWYQRDTWRRKNHFPSPIRQREIRERPFLSVHQHEQLLFLGPQHCRLRQRISETWRKSIVDRPGVQTSGMEQRVTHVLRPFS